MKINNFFQPYINSLHHPSTKKNFLPLVLIFAGLFVPFFTVILVLTGVENTRVASHADTNVLTGSVYIDTNNNGIKDPGESGFQGATITLSGTANNAAVTDLNGSYTFSDLEPGDYTVGVTSPDGYNATSSVNLGVGSDTSQPFNFGIVQEAGTHDIASFDFTASDGTLLEDYNAGWSRVDRPEGASGPAVITGNKIAPNSGEPYWYKLNQTDYNSCISADIQWPLAGYAELGLREQDVNNRATLSMTAPGDFGIVVQKGETTETKIAGSFTIPDGSHTIKFCDANNGIMRMYLDNVLKLDSPVGDNNLTAGSPSIRSYGAVLDNVTFIHQTVPQQIPHVSLHASATTTIPQTMTYVTNGSFADLDSNSWTATVDYGDGTDIQRLDFTEQRKFNLNHRFSTPGVYSVTVAVTDTQGITGTAKAQVTVDAVPVVSGLQNTTINSGDTYEAHGSFTDPDSTSWTASVDYGDGTGAQSLNLEDKSFALQHVYTEKRSYNVIVVVTDDKNISGNGDTVLTVNREPQVEQPANTFINEGTLYQNHVSYQDPDSLSWKIVLDYGDGTTPQILKLSGGEIGFDYEHMYSTYGVYAVNIAITDNLGLTSTTATTVSVNAVPKIATIPGAIINEGDTYHSLVTFEDPDSTAWTGRVDYGDGSGFQTIPLTSKNITLDHLYATYGVRTVQVEVTDDKGAIGTKTTTVKVNAIPKVNPITNGTANEGQAYQFAGSFIDPDSTSWTATVNYGDGLGVQPLTLTGKNFTLNRTYKDNGANTIKVTVKDDFPATGSASTIVTVNNVAPSVGAVSLSTALTKINTAVTATTTFTDPGVQDTHTASIIWGDGATTTATITGTNTSGSVKGSHSYTKAGYYTVTVKVNDKDGGAGQSTALLPVYSPSTSSFFTILNTPTPLLGINLKYTSAGLPTGTTDMQFSAQNIKFTAKSYQILVIANGEAFLKGTGTVNGSGSYTFLASGQNGSGNTNGKIRFQIKNSSGNVIYDTQPAAADNAHPLTPVKGFVSVR